MTGDEREACLDAREVLWGTLAATLLLSPLLIFALILDAFL